METFLNVVWWLWLVSMICQGIAMCTHDHPRKVTFSIGMDTCRLVLVTGFFLWVTYLKYHV